MLKSSPVAFRRRNLFVDEALAIVTRYFDEADLLPKTRLALEELMAG